MMGYISKIRIEAEQQFRIEDEYTRLNNLWADEYRIRSEEFRNIIDNIFEIRIRDSSMSSSANSDHSQTELQQIQTSEEGSSSSNRT